MCGVDRRLFFLALLVGAATFNLFYSFLAGCLLFGVLYAFALVEHDARSADAPDPAALRHEPRPLRRGEDTTQSIGRRGERRW